MTQGAQDLMSEGENGGTSNPIDRVADSPIRKKADSHDQGPKHNRFCTWYEVIECDPLRGIPRTRLAAGSRASQFRLKAARVNHEQNERRNRNKARCKYAGQFPVGNASEADFFFAPAVRRNSRLPAMQ